MRQLTVSLVVFHLFSLPAFADQVKSFFVGDTVVVIYDEGARLYVEQRVLATVPLGEWLKVKDTNGAACFVEWRDHRGWIDNIYIEQFLEARDFFTEAVRENPTAPRYVA